ncbi:hypothetical protein GCM10010261_11870 [Streptomyces pilosus]|nr:hypothetical protein GCM10010261_11870 [Streptomyces pilosus]
MRSLRLNGVVRGKRPRTTAPNPADTWAAVLLNSDFTTPAPEQKWITHFTYACTYQSFAYVAFIMDCSPRGSSPGTRPSNGASSWSTRRE